MSNSNNLPKLEYEDINSGYGTLNKDISKKFDNRKGILFEKNNILFGKLRPYLKKWYLSNFKGIALGDFWVLKTKGTNVNFVYYLIQSSSYQKVANNTSGTKMPRSDWKSVSQSPFYIPSIPEQSRVGNILKDVDLSITLQQRQLDLYKKLKKGLLQKLFPKNGKRVPEVRFVNFSEDWEEYKLSDLSTVSTGKAFSSSDFNENGKYLVITNKNISNDSKSNSFKTDRIDISDTKTIQKYNLDGKNILVTMDGVNLGKTGLFSNKNAVLAQRVGRIQSNQFEFVYQITSSNRFLSEMRKLSVGNAIKHISLKQISNYINLVPKSVMEQRYIGILLKNIDDTSITQNKKIKELKTLKKYLLQKLFI
ncbi:hypothetical protein LKI01_10550 [Companilactobacillus paralimentarius]|uniref:Type I restriction modification DNA specificity domain-containing protein n=3 Tax=Companilactobacillus kimchii TaxID=2801452 RepID=A0ABR5NTG3_9LACO|nr:hypothetical protein ATN91_13185 [Companilactobacillus kimchii]KRK51680.1 hypothetical protein FC97_GL000472 [Companilactobacillus kimchii DSM 13961 = JCM 10707]OWF34034.1 Type I site-specific deoxyribonuclease [Companilactobacillus kimchii]GEO47056.1 hypothetical protein LKI01_10550 [Companilactobacillus paralimentarius]